VRSPNTELAIPHRLPSLIPAPRNTNDLGSTGSCQGRATAWPFALAAVALAGCVYTPETTVRVRDPSAVQVDIEDEHGKTTTLLAPAATASEVPLPQTVPPFEEGIRMATTVRRHAPGPIDVHCAECDPETRVLVASDGTIQFDPDVRIVKLDWTRNEMRILFRDRRGASFGSTSTYEAAVATPWSNVAQVRRVSTPSRSMGLKLLLSAGVAGTLGAFALEDGVSLHHPTTTIFGAIILPLAVVLATGGTWYMVAAPQETVLYGDK
jgi:hypothetical protein